MEALKIPIHNVFGSIGGKSYCYSCLQSEFENIPSSWLIKMDHSFEDENLMDMKKMVIWRSKEVKTIQFSKGILDICQHGKQSMAFKSLISWYALEFIKTLKTIGVARLPFEQLHTYTDPNHYLSEVVTLEPTENSPQDVLDIYNAVIDKYNSLI
jgi:hypothetical protein